jgi:sec-independent protein translocase protein TatB
MAREASMFDFDVGKLLLIGVVALIFIPPKDLPNALRQLGRLIGQARRMAADFQGQFSEALREAELSDIKDELHNLKQKASVEDAFSHVADMLETKVDVPASAKVPGETPAAAEAPGETPGLSHSAGALGPTLPTAEPLATPQPEPLPEPLPLPEASKTGPGNAP